MTAHARWAELSRFADHAERGVLLWDHRGDLDDADYWAAVADAWQDCERQPLSAAQWRDLWGSDRAGREHVMSPLERTRLAALPPRVTIYRGWNAISRGGSSGMSWTLKRDQALWFARRRHQDGALITGSVRRERILAYFDARDEAEIVVLPKYVYGRTTVPVHAATGEVR